MSNRKQRVKVGGIHSSWREILYRVPQRSILWQLLFNISLCDLFCSLEGTDRASYVSDTTSYNAKLTQKLGINKLEEISSILFQ